MTVKDLIQKLNEVKDSQKEVVIYVEMEEAGEIASKVAVKEMNELYFAGDSPEVDSAVVIS